MTRTLAAVLLGGLALLPANAAAHSTIQIQGADITYFSEDSVSDNKLVVDETPTSIRFRDPEADAGIVGPSNCTPGDQQGAYAYEMTCPRTGIRRLTVDLGPNQDSMVANVLTIAVGGTGGSGADNIKVNGAGGDFLNGDQGNDTIDTGDGNDDLRGDDGADTLLGGNGNDAIQGGLGADTIDAGEGDDTVITRDGVADRVNCGNGIDTVRADTADEVAPDCESVERIFVAPPADSATGEDNARPQLQVGGSTSQRVSSRRRTIKVAAALSEQGEVSASGFLDAGGINSPLKSKRYKVSVAGGGVTIAIRLSKSQIRRALRDLRRRRRVYVRVNVVGSDVAGNSVVARTLKIRLRK